MIFRTRIDISLQCLLLLLLCLALGTACTTTGSSTSNVAVGVGQKDDLKEADQFFDQGQYKLAQLKYSSYLYSPFSKKENLPHARYRLGLSHYLQGEHREAADMLKTLIQEYPNHPMAAQAKEIITKSEQELNRKRQAEQAGQLERAQRITQLQQFIAQDPNNAEYHFRLGNLYWENGLWNEAVASYQKAATINPAYLEQTTVKQRVRITPDGQYTTKDPVVERAQQEQVRVSRAELQVKRDRNWLGDVESLIFSGEVVNDGVKDVSNVQVEVTLYDFFERIQDVKLIPIGVLPAGARRSFALPMGQYQGMGMDMRHRTRVIYTP